MNDNLHLLDFCGNCRFWRDHECRRFPPQLAMWATDNQHPIMYATCSQYPECHKDTACCGEFKAVERPVLRAER